MAAGSPRLAPFLRQVLSEHLARIAASLLPCSRFYSTGAVTGVSARKETVAGYPWPFRKGDMGTLGGLGDALRVSDLGVDPAADQLAARA